MILYLFSSLFPLIFYFSKKYLYYKKRYSYIILALLPIFLLFFLKNRSVGTDTSHYVDIFMSIDKYSFRDIIFNDYLFPKDKGFYIFTRLIRCVTSSYAIYYFFCGLVIFGGITYFLKNHSDNPFLTISLIILLNVFSFIQTGLRQSIAISICLFSIKYLGKLNIKSLFFFVSIIFVAFLFHKSASIFLLAYPICLIKNNKSKIIVTILLIIIFSFNFIYFQDFFGSILDYNYEIEQTGNGYITLVFYLLLAIYNNIINFNFFDKDETNSVITSIAYMCILFWFLRMITRMAERISLFFMVPLCSYYSFIFKKNNRFICKALSFIAFCLCLILFIYRNNELVFYFFWE